MNLLSLSSQVEVHLIRPFYAQTVYSFSKITFRTTRNNNGRVRTQKTNTTVSQLNSLDKPFSEEEVKQSIKMLKNKKAVDLDRIRNEY